MDRNLGLLDKLQRDVKCEYLSSLRDDVYKEGILNAIEKYTISDYSCQAWSEAIHYIFDTEQRIETHEDVKAFVEKEKKILRKD